MTNIIANYLYTNEQSIKQPVISNSTPKPGVQEVKILDKQNNFSPAQDHVLTLLIGLIAQDTICSIPDSISMNDSNPAQICSSVGGVGHNIALAYRYSMQSKNLDPNCRLVSAVGDDVVGKGIIEHLERDGVDVSGIKILSNSKTAQYVAHLDSEGKLVLASADMKIIEGSSLIDHITSEIKRGRPKLVVVDCNLSPNGLDAVFNAVASLDVYPRVIVEPTSGPKLSRLTMVNSSKLKVFPHNSISLITPTVEELSNIHKSLGRREFFDDYDSWFPLLDLLGMNSNFREKMAATALKVPAMKKLLDEGVIQQAVQILPYIPNILVKLGAYGCVFISINTNVNDYKSIPTTSQYLPTIRLISQGREYEEGKLMGITIEYFSVPPENENLSIVDVTGAGDSLLGYLTSLLTQHDWLNNEVELLEQEWGKWEGIYKSQIASGLTLESAVAVSEKIACIK